MGKLEEEVVYSSLVQLVERLTVNQKVSSPKLERGAKNFKEVFPDK